MAKTQDIKVLVGANIKKMREEVGFSREQLAAKTRLSARYIYALETGRNVTIETLSTLSQALGCSICDIVCNQERAPSKRDGFDLALKVLQRHRDKL